jgi:Tfp pilus assembly protein PilF
VNLLAILYKRKGHPEKTFEVYEFLDKNNILSYTVLENFASILFKEGDTQRADGLMQKIELTNEDNPSWLYAARKQVELQNYTCAKRYL